MLNYDTQAMELLLKLKRLVCPCVVLILRFGIWQQDGRMRDHASLNQGSDAHSSVITVFLSRALCAEAIDLRDMSRMILRTEGPQRLPAGYEMVLYIPMSDSDKVGVFYVENPFFGQRYIHVLGRRKLYHVVKYTGGSAELEFFVEGLRFPDDTFSGLVSINISLLESLTEGIPRAPIFTDTVVFRVAPWIMTPNILAPVNVFVCSVKDNYLFLKEVKSLVSKASCDLKVCFGYVNRGDRWMQDEIEFGYIHAPHKCFPVVLDSPRDGGLKDFPIKEILGPDFGYVTRDPLFEAVTSLDSFGNLEVSPPVTVNGKAYPLGRILIGSSFPTSAGRRMTKVVREFLYAQQVQSPVELYSDWLTVGHVDEFVTFVPLPDKKQFRMLMASTSACYKLFREKQKEGHGEATMFKGYSGADTKRVTINKVLSNGVMVQENQYVQRCIDWNRDILKKELGLTEKDIIDLPALFKIDKMGKAMAYFPNMVNMIVLSRDLGIPKPFGPIIEGDCCLEAHVRSLLEPLGLMCSFIDDISSYHKMLGEVHCGTNVHRKPFSFKWWHVIP
ncbi:protein-arginine deiminase type-2 isoform X3 [Dermochelys coriacea]|uniref:protein-arginine deiminase type-2 isoform X3 n=1 Tax=Dermochelys coriacea TaxID=27794 RepID=UPI001CA883E4|nr:protein-arginine deiminase type-2 isoform X3 [Dermochelys coriacea]